MEHHSLADSESGRGLTSPSTFTSGIMKLLIFILCCIGSTLADSQAEASEMSSTTNKLSSSKSTLNSIPSAPAQKTTLLQQSHSVQSNQQPQSHQYIPQYVVQKQVQHQQPAAMFIIAQPGPQGGHQSPLFQQAVHQLLSYYNNNPQAKYQLLQQQGGLPHGTQVQAQPQPQTVYHHQMPSGALHVIPSPQLDSQNVQHLAAAPSGVVQQQLSHQSPQATYVIPAQSQQILAGLNPALLAQFAAQIPQNQHAPIPIQFAPQQILSHAQPFGQLGSGHFLAQQIPQFNQQFAHQSPQFAHQSPQFTHQIPAGHFTLAPQFATGLGQAHVQAQQLPANIQLGSSGPGQAQAQFGAKQSAVAQNANDYSTQTEKSHQSSASSSYNPVYRTAYVKG